VSDHHAIIPTEQSPDISDFTDKELKIYDLVVTRFLSVFFPPYEYEATSVKIKIGAETFTAKGNVVLSNGYKDVYLHDEGDEDEDDSGSESRLPKLSRGDTLRVSGIKLTEGKTSPPPPFNEASLLSAMENPAKHMDTSDKTIADVLNKTGGLGTVATRADIIEKLFDNFLIEKKGKEIFATSKGRQLLTLVPEELKSPELTGVWERQLTGISEGKINKNEFIKSIKSYTSRIINDIKNSAQTFKHDNLSTTKCPECGKFMLKVAGKKGEMLVCPDRECNSRINVSLSIRSKCPACDKFMRITGDGDRRWVVCVCGHRESYANFEKRKKEEGDAPSKKELQNYIDKINKDDAKNNPFAALKGIKFDN